MDRPPLVAIVTPVLNGDRFLAETMACVQAQTYPNLVHCLLDNASIDRTADIIAGQSGGRVPIIAARNAKTLPMHENWNAALSLMPPSAAYFRVLPADDLMMPTCIEKMVTLGEHNLGVGVIGCQEYIDDRPIASGLPTDQTVFPGAMVVRESLRGRIRGFPHAHCLFRRQPDESFDQFYTLEYYGTRILATDIDAVMRILSTSDYGCVQEPLVITRTHGNSVSSTDRGPNALQLWSDLQLIDAWGPRVFADAQEYKSCRRAHLLFYYRHLLLWKALGRRALLEQHRGWLARAAALPTPLDLIHAVVEWPLLSLKKGTRRNAAA